MIRWTVSEEVFNFISYLFSSRFFFCSAPHGLCDFKLPYTTIDDNKKSYRMRIRRGDKVELVMLKRQQIWFFISLPSRNFYLSFTSSSRLIGFDVYAKYMKNYSVMVQHLSYFPCTSTSFSARCNFIVTFWELMIGKTLKIIRRRKDWWICNV